MRWVFVKGTAMRNLAVDIGRTAATWAVIGAILSPPLALLWALIGTEWFLGLAVVAAFVSGWGRGRDR